jgi:hypothetical protein
MEKRADLRSKSWVPCRRELISGYQAVYLILPSFASVRALDVHDDEVGIGRLGQPDACSRSTTRHTEHVSLHTLCGLPALVFIHDGELCTKEAVEESAFSR